MAAVVRLNEAKYDAGAFDYHGILHHDLYFEDCTCPPPSVARAQPPQRPPPSSLLQTRRWTGAGGGGALQGGAGADGDADRTVHDAVGGIRGAGGDGVS